jgi:hypothetical protein
MDLITAKVDAAAKSKKERVAVFVNVYSHGHKDEGDCFISLAPSKTTQAIFLAGEEVKEGSAVWQGLMDSDKNKSLRTEETPLKIASDNDKGKPIDPRLLESPKSKPKLQSKAEEPTAAKVKKVVEKKSKKKMPVTKTKPAKKVAAKKVAKKEAPKKKVEAKILKPEGPKEEKLIRGNNMALTEAQWAKVDAAIKKDGAKSFSSWSRDLVLAKIK